MPATYGRNNLAKDQVTAHSAPTRQAREPSYAKGSARTKSGSSHNQTTPLVGLPLGSPPRQALRHVLPKQTLAMDSSPGGHGDQDMNWPLNSTRWPMQGRVRRCLLARCYWWLPRSVRWPALASTPNVAIASRVRGRRMILCSKCQGESAAVGGSSQRAN
jgi:hypothetical protein